VSESEFLWLIMSVADDIGPNPLFPLSSNHDVSTLIVLVVAVSFLQVELKCRQLRRTNLSSHSNFRILLNGLMASVKKI
jgi:hypothetical protein